MASLFGLIPIPGLNDEQAKALAVGAGVAVVMLYGNQLLNTVVKPAYRQ